MRDITLLLPAREYARSTTSRLLYFAQARKIAGRKRPQLLPLLSPTRHGRQLTMWRRPMTYRHRSGITSFDAEYAAYNMHDADRQ